MGNVIRFPGPVRARNHKNNDFPDPLSVLSLSLQVMKDTVNNLPDDKRTLNYLNGLIALEEQQGSRNNILEVLYTKVFKIKEEKSNPRGIAAALASRETGFLSPISEVPETEIVIKDGVALKNGKPYTSTVDTEKYPVSGKSLDEKADAWSSILG